MLRFDWDNINSHIFTIEGITNRTNADKLFVCLLIEIEKKGIDISKEYCISEIAELIPQEVTGIDSNSTYGYSFMSMLSGQKYRDYFIFKKDSLRDEFTKCCNNPNRNNYYWKNYLKYILKINPKYILI